MIATNGAPVLRVLYQQNLNVELEVTGSSWSNRNLYTTWRCQRHAMETNTWGGTEGGGGGTG